MCHVLTTATGIRLNYCTRPQVHMAYLYDEMGVMFLFFDRWRRDSHTMQAQSPAPPILHQVKSRIPSPKCPDEDLDDIPRGEVSAHALHVPSVKKSPKRRMYEVMGPVRRQYFPKPDPVRRQYYQRWYILFFNLSASS